LPCRPSKAARSQPSYLDSHTIIERLAKFNPGNVDWQRRLQICINEIGEIAYNFVLARNFTTALEAADQAISFAPEKTWLYASRAHALMFLDHVNEARALYLKYKGQNVSGGHLWDAAILQDFAELQKAGLTHPLM
jgi:hypothetical protein